jgi:vacuolar-type H+-ATPase subunit I/STV1
MKALSDRRLLTADKHKVFTVTPTIPVPEEDIHKELDSLGSAVLESMEANREKEAERIKEKQRKREEKRAQVAKERVALLEERDRRTGTLDMVRTFKGDMFKPVKKRR